MECFNECYVGKIANFRGKCRFYRKTGCKIGEMEGNLFYEEWFLGMRFRIEFGMTLWQYSGWRIFFWFWNIACYASGWGWQIGKKNDTRLKMSKDISVFYLGRKNWGYTNKCIPSFVVKIVFLFSFFHYKTYIDCF